MEAGVYPHQLSARRWNRTVSIATHRRRLAGKPEKSCIRVHYEAYRRKSRRYQYREEMGR